MSIRPMLAGLGLIVSLSSTVCQGADDADSLAQQLHHAAAENRMRLEFDGESFSGPAWDRLLAEGQRASFFLIGEEHGIAENPKLAAALFKALSGHGYNRVAIEISPPMAGELDRALREGGLDGLLELFELPGGEPAFFGMREEAEFLAAVRAAMPDEEPVLWGTDYEVGGDRHLIRLLGGFDKPEPAARALDQLLQAADAGWTQMEESGDPRHIFSFSGDPALVRAVRDAWPGRSDEVEWILHTLEETLEINRLWVSGRAWESNERRGRLLRGNFLRHWQAARKHGRSPKVMLKFGASHLVRGRNTTETFDLGALLPELAEIEGTTSFSVLVVPGAGTKIARFNPVRWSYEPVPAREEFVSGFGPILQAAHDDAFTLIDLRPLRPIVGMRNDVPAGLMRLVHGFDSVLVMSGSTPATSL